MLCPESALMDRLSNHMFCVGCQQVGVLCLRTPAGMPTSDAWGKPLLRPLGCQSPHAMGSVGWLRKSQALNPVWVWGIVDEEIMGRRAQIFPKFFTTS